MNMHIFTLLCVSERQENDFNRSTSLFITYACTHTLICRFHAYLQISHTRVKYIYIHIFIYIYIYIYIYTYMHVYTRLFAVYNIIIVSLLNAKRVIPMVM